MNKLDGHEGGGRREECNQAWEGLRAAVGAQPPNPTLGLNIPGQRQEALHSALLHVAWAQRSPQGLTLQAKVGCHHGDSSCLTT